MKTTSTNPSASAEQPVNGDPPTAQRVAELESELDRVKTEHAAEQERLDRRTGWRRFFSTLLAIVAAASIVFSVTGIWLRTTMLNSERFAAAAGPLTKNDDVAEAVSGFVAAEIVAHTNAEQEIKGVLPADAQVLAGPITSGLEDGLAEVVDDIVQTDQFEAIFETTVQISHEEALLILEGDGDAIESSDGKVTLNLITVINDVMREASADLSAVFGTTIELPTISQDDIPADQIAELEATLGVQLPADFGQVTLFQSDELERAQTWVNRFDTWLEVMIAVAIVSTIGALALAFDRSRTVITIGIAVPLFTIVTWLLVDGAEDDYFAHVDDPSGRAAARAATDVMFAGLDRVAWWMIGLSLMVVAIAALSRRVTVEDTAYPPSMDSDASDASDAEVVPNGSGVTPRPTTAESAESAQSAVRTVTKAGHGGSTS